MERAGEIPLETCTPRTGGSGQTHQNQAKNSAASGESEALPRLIRLSPFACPFFSGLGMCCFFDRRMGTNELSARLNARPAGFIQDLDAFALTGGWWRKDKLPKLSADPLYVTPQ
jgi:hypothetical protein